MKRVAVLALLGLSCGGGDDGCPTNDCSVQGRTVVKWTLDHYPEWGFDSDTCLDMGATTMYVHLQKVTRAAPNEPVPIEQEVNCSQSQATFLALEFGTYAVSIDPRDADGNSLVKAQISGTILAGSADAPTETTINVPWDAWSGSYTGSLLFRLKWYGASCEVNGVATQTLKLTAGGVITTKVSDSGQKLDGSDPKPCRPLSEQFSQGVNGLPFGPAKLEVVGKAADNTLLFSEIFDTFVGSTENNPTITFDLAPMDAPVDSAPDAPPDAAIDAPPEAGI